MKISQKLQAQIDIQNQQLSKMTLVDLFNNDPKRFERFSIEANGLLLDYSKNHIDQAVHQSLISLAEENQVMAKMQAMHAGESINQTENRPALHCALRDLDLAKRLNLDEPISQSLKKMADITQRIHQDQWLGYSQKPIDTIVNIGIGGSHLGPQLVTEALSDYRNPKLNILFWSNIDPDYGQALLKTLNPETTLFIVSSKSLSTLETLTNAQLAKQWLIDAGDTHNSQQMLAMTANPDAAQKLGVSPDNTITLWDWVGGRYSLWSAVGLPAMISIGVEHFTQLLAGAKAMDQHALNTAPEQNMPLTMALLDSWYNNLTGDNAKIDNQAIIPYCEALRSLPSWLQQLAMESNGKSVDTDGTPINCKTSPIIWGACGTNSQHSFHQLLLQGTTPSMIDFIVPLKSISGQQSIQQQLVNNAFAQSAALMHGTGEVSNPHQYIAGNRCSNTLLINELTPYALGNLLSLYENKVMMQGFIWQINPFDQFGVELGKKLANDLNDHINQNPNDSSTIGLINQYQQTTKEN